MIKFRTNHLLSRSYGTPFRNIIPEMITRAKNAITRSFVRPNTRSPYLVLSTLHHDTRRLYKTHLHSYISLLWIVLKSNILRNISLLFQPFEEDFHITKILPVILFFQRCVTIVRAYLQLRVSFFFGDSFPSNRKEAGVKERKKRKFESTEIFFVDNGILAASKMMRARAVKPKRLEDAYFLDEQLAHLRDSGRRCGCFPSDFFR